MNVKCISTTVKIFNNGKLFDHDIKYLITIGHVYKIIYDDDNKNVKYYYIMPDNCHYHCRLPFYLFEITQERETDLEESRNNGDKINQNVLNHRKQQMANVGTIFKEIIGVT